MDVLFKQYELICERRETLFKFCESIQQPHFVKSIESFGSHSMCYLTVHIVNTYTFWIAHFADIDKQTFVAADQVKNVSDVRQLFAGTNHIVNLFLEKYQPDYEAAIVNKVPMREFEVSLTPLQLFTHVITHEYHHKGQILSMSRQLGYTPVDTDIIRLG